MNEEQAGNSRTGELNGIEKIAMQGVAHTALLRAIVETHPDPHRLRSVFDEIIGQSLAKPAFQNHPEFAQALRYSSELLFGSEGQQSDQP